jgi:hypothetical protein
MAKTAAEPTYEDAKLLLEFIELGYMDTMQKAFDWFWANLPEEPPMTLEEFEQKFPAGSAGAKNLNLAAGHFETAGVLVRRGLLNENLFFDRFLIAPFWDRAKKVVKGSQKKYNPLIGENFEWLARRAEGWARKRTAARKKR